MEIVNVKNLKKLYGDFLAVDNISFHINKGEIFGFLGPNGAGKTSTINMLTGLSRPSGGEIHINSIDAVRDIKKVQRIIGIVPDESNLYGEMNGFDNLCFCAALYGMEKKEREKKAKELLNLFNLTEAGNRPFRAYSKGMKRKLTIAAGIIHNPKILFLDEPTTGIDVESARHIRKLILDLKDKGTTIFLTTHYLEEAQRICDRIALIVKGRIVKIGTVNELLESTMQGHIVQLTYQGRMETVQKELKEHFPGCTIKILSNDSSQLINKEPVPLFPLLQLLHNKGVSVYEAKEIKPTLEDVFVEITGLETDRANK